MRFARILLVGAALGAIFLAPGCGGDNAVLSAESDEAWFREGQQLEKQGQTQEALSFYLKVIAKRGDQAPESHLDAGLIYLYHIKDPIDAIYYFRKYLELQPNSRQAPDVRGLIDTAKRDFAASLPAQPLEDQSGRLDLTDQVNRLESENKELRAEIMALRGGAPPPAPSVGAGISPALFTPPVVPVTERTDQAEPAVVPVPVEPAAPVAAPAPPPAPTGRTHTVVKGDTLFSLAQRYYGSRSKWREILAANRDQLPGENSTLRIGMTLRMP